MRSEPRGILAIWHDITNNYVEETLDWYDREHHFERLAVPGFINVRRYHAVEATPFLFIRYETESRAVLSSAAYIERLNNPTPWTLASQPRFLNNSRTVCTLIERGGLAEGGHVATIQLDEATWAEFKGGPKLRKLTQGLLGLPGVVGFELLAADREMSMIATREKELRRKEDEVVAAVVVVHATNPLATRIALERVLADLPAPLSGAARHGSYSLAFAAQKFTI